jgi:hypothetical protein
MSGTQSAAALAMRAMITAGHRARMIQIAAQLGIAEILARGPADSVLLAAESGCNVAALGRLLSRGERRLRADHGRRVATD